MPQRGDPITQREEEILELIACGYDVEEIADTLGISQSTLRVRISNIRVKIGAPTADVWMVALPEAARRHGVAVPECEE